MQTFDSLHISWGEKTVKMHLLMLVKLSEIEMHLNFLAVVCTVWANTWSGILCVWNVSVNTSPVCVCDIWGFFCFDSSWIPGVEELKQTQNAQWIESITFTVKFQALNLTLMTSPHIHFKHFYSCQSTVKMSPAITVYHRFHFPDKYYF